MSGCEPEDPSIDADPSDSGIDLVDDVIDPWTDDTTVLEEAPSLDGTDPSPYDDIDDVDANELDADLDGPTTAPPEPAWEPPAVEVPEDWAADDPEIDLGDELPAVGGNAVPELFEDGSLVSQVRIAVDLVTVDDLTETETYEQWAQGGDGAPILNADGTHTPGTGFDRPGVVGDSGDVNFWFKQTEKNSCGPSVAAQIISDFTGVMHRDEYALIGRARGYLAEEGMDPEELAGLLSQEGVPARSLRNQDFGDVEQYLREGKSVVMFLDSKDVIGPGYEAFAATDETEDSATDSVDHFVRVIGIDRQAGVAIIANSGQFDGSQVEVPLERLEEAWDDNTLRPGYGVDRAHILVVSDGADPTPDDGGAAAPQPTPDPQPQPQPDPTPDPQPVPGPEGPAGPVGTPSGPAPGPDDPAPVRLPSPPLEPVPSPTGQAQSRPDGPSDVELQAPARAFPAAPSTPTEIALPVTADDGLPAASAPDKASEDDDDNLFDDPRGWVLIPVTLAAGRLAMAARDHLAKRH